MPEASVIVELSVEMEADTVDLEMAVADEGRRAARALYQAALADADKRCVEASGGARQRIEERWMATLMGRVRVRRYRVRVESRTHHPLDDMLGLPRGEASPAVRALVHRLANRFSSRQIAHILKEITGVTLSRQVLSRILGEGCAHERQ